MLHLAEVALAQAEEDGAVDLRLAADIVVLAGVERLPVLVEPGLVRLVLVADEHRAAVPVVGLAPQVVAAPQNQKALSGRPQSVPDRPAPGPRPDDDDLVVPAHDGFL